MRKEDSLDRVQRELDNEARRQMLSRVAFICLGLVFSAILFGFIYSPDEMREAAKFFVQRQN